MNNETGMTIKVLGTGCANCQRLHQNVEAAIAEAGLSATVEKVEGIPEIVAYGVMRTPALVVDEQVILSGRVPSRAELVTLLRGRA
jgi:small redox-active disulfide protein 2